MTGITGVNNKTSILVKQAIELNYAQYNPTTAEFEWKENK